MPAINTDSGARQAQPPKRKKPTYSGTIVPDQQDRQPAPAPKPRGDTPGDAQFKKADKFKKTAPYRGAVRDAYKAKPVADRQQEARGLANLDAPSPENTAVLNLHILRSVVDARRKARIADMVRLSPDNVDRTIEAQNRQEDPNKFTPGPDQLDRSANARLKQLLGDFHQGGDTKGDAETTKAETFKKTNQFVADKFAAIKANYDQASPAEKNRIFGNPKQDAKNPETLKKFKIEDAKLSAAGVNGDVFTKAYAKLLHAPVHPALAVMEQLGKPLHVAAAVAQNEIEKYAPGLAADNGTGRHESAGKRVLNNLTGKEHTGGGEVLGQLGVTNKKVRGIGGAVLDVAGDPLNVITFGAATPAEIAARAASRGVLRNAPHDLERAVQEAAKASAGKATNRGIHVSLRVPFSGREFSSGGKATAFVSRHTGLHQAAKAARDPENKRARIIDSLANFAPDLRRSTEGKAEFDQRRTAEAHLRAESHRTPQQAAHERTALRGGPRSIFGRRKGKGATAADLPHVERAPIDIPDLHFEMRDTPAHAAQKALNAKTSARKGAAGRLSVEKAKAKILVRLGDQKSLNAARKLALEDPNDASAVIVRQFDDARRTHNKASKRVSDARKAVTNSHTNRDLYNDAERSAAVAEYDAARVAAKGTKSELQQATTLLEDAATRSAGRAARRGAGFQDNVPKNRAGNRATPLDRLGRAPTRHVNTASADLEAAKAEEIAALAARKDAGPFHSKQEQRIVTSPRAVDPQPSATAHFEPGSLRRGEPQDGRGFILKDGTLHTWIERGPTHEAVADKLKRDGADTKGAQRFGIGPSGGINGVHDVSDDVIRKILEGDPRLKPPKGRESLAPPKRAAYEPGKDYLTEVRPGLAKHEPTTPVQHWLRERNQQMADQGVASGALTPDQVRPDYFHHALPENLDPGEGIKALIPGRGKSKPAAFAEHRSVDASVAEAKKLGVEFSQDVPSLHARRVLQGGQRDSRIKFADAIVKGRPKFTGQEFVPKYESVWEQAPNGKLAPVGEKALKDAKATGKYPDNWHVLNSTNAKGAYNAVNAGTAATSQGFHAFNKYFQGPWKTAVTMLNASYHFGNEVGNRIMAWQADTTVQAWNESHRMIRLLAKRAKWEKANTTPGAKFEDTLTGKGIRNRKSDAELWKFIKEAESEGALSSGVASHELQYLRDKAPGVIRRFGERRENQPRLATYLSARQRGMNPRQAAQWTNKHHIDYGDLTPAEKWLRDHGIPFYTFTARNTRLQTQKLLERPNKAANFELLREDSQKYAGEDPNFARTLKRYQQAGMPFVFRFGGASYLLTPRTPIDQGLSRAIGTPGDWGNAIGAALGPIKLPFELGFDYSTFRREHIEQGRPDNGQVIAPTWLAKLANDVPAIRDLLKVKHRDTGEWEWRAKTDFVLNVLPATKTLKDVTLPKNAENPYQQKPWQSAVSAAGVKVSTFDKQQIISQHKREDLQKAKDARDEFDRIHTKQRESPAGGDFNSKRREALVKAVAAAQKEVDKYDKRPKTTPLQPRPLSIQEQFRKRREDFKKRDPQAEFRKQRERERARRLILKGKG